MPTLPAIPETAACIERHSENPVRFYSLDVLRGVAALVVVVYHWTLFTPRYFPPAAETPLVFQSVLHPIYVHGFVAVDMFFILSGFIFYWLYSKSIAEGNTSVWKFAVHRFSRLYPLHFLTLIIAACLQYAVREMSGYDYVYGNNTLPRFALQLFFICNANFNGPVWTVSRELLCYCVFFALCWMNWRRWWHVAACIALGIFVGRDYQTARFFAEFFIGGLTYYAFTMLDCRFTPFQRSLAVIASVAAWIGAMATFRYAPTSIAVPLLTFLVFPLTVLACALNDTRWRRVTAALKLLGDISYSSYLLHFPLQLLCVAVLLLLGKNISVMQKPLAFVLFLALLIPLSSFCYRRFERPPLSRLRRTLLKPPRTDSVARPQKSLP
jgi:peptidoglycan/LPS O-acetylase OafA/YrhL